MSVDFKILSDSVNGQQWSLSVWIWRLVWASVIGTLAYCYGDLFDDNAEDIKQVVGSC